MQLEEELYVLQNQIETSVSKAIKKNSMLNLEYQSVDNSIKVTNNHINALQTSLKDVEGTVMNLQRITDKKCREEFCQINKQIDHKIIKNRSEVISLLQKFRSEIQKQLKQNEKFSNQNPLMSSFQQEEFNNKNSQDFKLTKDLQNSVQHKIEGYLEKIKGHYDKDIGILFKEMATLRCEMELLYDQKRKENVAAHISEMSRDLSMNEKRLKINNLEQAIFIHELDKFNKDNTQRIIYDLYYYEEKIERLMNDIIELENPSQQDVGNLLSELDIIQEKISNTKFQIEGTKKKYLYDMKRIEEKMLKLNGFKQQFNSEMNNNVKKNKYISEEIKIIEQFPEKIKFLMESINNNLETIEKQFIQIVELVSRTRESFKNQALL